MRVEKAPGLLEPYTIYATEEEFKKIVKVTSENEGPACAISAKEILLKQMALLQERSESCADLHDCTEASRVIAHLAEAYATLRIGEEPVYISAAESGASRA